MLRIICSKPQAWLWEIGLVGLMLLVLVACQPQPTPTLSAPTVPASVTATLPTATQTPLTTATRILDLEQGLEKSQVPTTTQATSALTEIAAESFTAVGTVTATQGPIITETPLVAATQSQQVNTATQQPTPTSAASEPYPGIIPIQESYPGATTGGEINNSAYTGESSGIFGALEQTNPTLPPPTPTSSRLSPSPTPAGATSTPGLRATSTLAPVLPTSDVNGVFQPLEIPPDEPSPVVEIWHSLAGNELDFFESIVRTFQDAHPQVSVLLVYYPQDVLQEMYTTAVYQGRGPDLLIGPSEWNFGMASRGLAMDLKTFFPAAYWRAFLSPGLLSGQFQGRQTSIPYALSGVVLYRNQKIVPTPASSLTLLTQAAQDATRAGVIGAYLDLSAYNAMALYDRMGGHWLDDTGRPSFDQGSYAKAVEWLALLADLDKAGVIDVNTNRDTSLFMQGKVGYILDGTWNLSAIAQSVGTENLAIDPWPTTATGRLAGYVQAQSLYLNPATAANQDANLYAALQFLGGLTSLPAQQRLAESGFIPVRRDVQAEDRLIRQAVSALQGGVPYPPVLQDPIQQVYWKALEDAIRSSLGIGTSQKNHLDALKTAFQEISQQLTRILK